MPTRSSVDFAEGNGQNAGVPGAQSTRGSGPGVTWRCAKDAEIANQATDCDPRWNGGTFGPATAPSVLHVNGLSGAVSWDVTDDVLAGASAWLIRKTAEGQSGQVSYFSKEGSASAGPRLILEGTPVQVPFNCLTAGGVEVGGACWFAGAESGSCAAACAAVGGVYDVATRDYAGSGSEATLAKCVSVLQALGLPLVEPEDVECSAGYGCFAVAVGARFAFRCVSPETTDGADLGATRRACACMP